MGRKFAVVDQARNQGKKFLNMNSMGGEWGADEGLSRGQGLMDDGYMM